jgi:hypothetical protein
MSPDFLASGFIMGEELPALVDHEGRLGPVLLDYCLRREERLLASVQWAHDPGRHGRIAAAPRCTQPRCW